LPIEAKTKKVTEISQLWFVALTNKFLLKIITLSISQVILVLNSQNIIEMYLL
jgi:hypothetical protein